MSRLVRWGPRAARVSERAVLASQASRAFSDSPKTEAPASAPEAAAKDDNEFKVSARAVDPRKTRTQLADEALYRTPMGKRVEELRKYTGLISNEAAVDPVLKETIRRNETAAASADMKKKAEWNKILASNISTDAKAKKLIAAGAPSHVVLNTLHFGKPRVVLRQVDRGNTDTQDYAALARDRFMEEFDASSYDYENSSDPDVLPRQRPFTRDEMHRILQDVEATRSKDAARAYEEQLLMPTSIMLHLANSTANMSLAHDAVDAAAGDMNVISEDPAGLSETIGNTRKEMYEAAELERRARVRKGVTSVSRGADAASTAQGVATLVDGAAGPVNSPAGARGIGSASVTHVVPATGVAGVPGHADAAVEAGTRLLGLAAEGSLGSLPVSAPTAPQDPRTPYGNVARPFANIFDEAAARAREITVEGFLNEKAIPANLRPPTMGEFNPHGIEYPFPKSYEGEKAWNESRPANLSADKDPMVRRVPDSILNGELEYAGDGSGDIMVDITSGPYNPNYRLPKGLTEAGSYREAIAMLSLPEYRGFAEKLSGLSREEQLERLVPLAQLYRTAMTAPPDGIDRAEVTRAKRRSLEAKRAAEHGQEWQEFAVNELDGEEKEESETVVLLREVNEFLSDYRPVSGVDPVADNDYRFGSAVSPFPANTSLGDVEHTLFSIAENDRFAAYYQQPVVSPTGDVEHLKMDQDLVSFDEVQRSEFAKAARKRNDPKVLQSIGSNRIRRFRKGMELYSGLPEHLLDYIDFHALPANDPRRVTHPLAVKLQRQIDELHAKSAPRSTEYSLGGSVAVHSDAEFADAGADDMPLSLVKATRESRARAALAATGKTAEEARMELIAPFSESDREMRIGSYVAHVLADNHLEFRDFESGFESEITRRKTLAATAAADGGDKDVRLVDATDGEVEPSYDVRPIVSLVDKIYGRESRLNKEIAAILSTLPAVQQSAVGTLYAADPAAAKRAIQQAIDRYTILAAIGSGTLDVPQDLLLERGLGRLKALIPPEVDFVAAAKAVATGKTVDGASGAGVIGSVLGTEAGAKADAQSSLGLGDGKDAIFPVHAAIDGTENPKGDGVFTNAIKYATEAARLEQVRKMLSARGLDSTGVRQRQRVAEEAARIEALDALAKVEAKRSAAKSDANLEAELRLPRDPNFRMVGAPGMPLDDVSKTDPLIVDAADFEGDEVNIRTFDNPLRPVPRAELGDDDPLARTLQDPVEYLPDHLAPAQLRVLYNDVERRIESAFFKNEISEADWNVMYQSVRAREVVQNMDNSDSEERDLAIFRREIVTGAAENSREQAAHRHQLSEHDTIINDYDMNRNDEVDDSRLHRASRLLSPYEILPVTDAAIPPFIAIEQQTHIYNLHKLDPSTFHPRWIAKRLNITPAAVVAMLKAQDLVHKSHLPARAEEVGTPFDSRRNGTMPVLNVKDERVLFPRTLDDLQIPYPPEQLLDATDVEGDLQLDAPHLIGRVSFDDDIFRDPAWQYEAYAPVRLVTDPEVAARTVEREEDRLNRLWARKDTIADAVEKASFAKFGPVHWASGQRTLHRPPKLPREIISRDLQPPSKHNWVLTSTDESFRSTFSIQVRDRDGYLRHPTFREFNAIRLRERDRRLAFFWRRHKVLAKLPEVSSAYVDNVMNAMMRTDGATKFGATVRTLLSETEEERDAISAAEGDVNRGIDLGEMAHVARLADFYLDLDKDASDSDFGLAEPENSVKVSKVE